MDSMVTLNLSLFSHMQKIQWWKFVHSAEKLEELVLLRPYVYTSTNRQMRPQGLWPSEALLHPRRLYWRWRDHSYGNWWWKIFVHYLREGWCFWQFSRPRSHHHCWSTNRTSLVHWRRWELLLGHLWQIWSSSCLWYFGRHQDQFRQHSCWSIPTSAAMISNLSWVNHPSTSRAIFRDETWLCLHWMCLFHTQGVESWLGCMRVWYIG